MEIMKPPPQKVITATYKRWLFMKGSNNRGLTGNKNYYYYYFKVVWIKKKKKKPTSSQVSGIWLSLPRRGLDFLIFTVSSLKELCHGCLLISCVTAVYWSLMRGGRLQEVPSYMYIVGWFFWNKRNCMYVFCKS